MRAFELTVFHDVKGRMRVVVEASDAYDAMEKIVRALGPVRFSQRQLDSLDDRRVPAARASKPGNDEPRDRIA